MTSNVPRDPEHYWPSDHAIDMHKTRNIDLEDIAEAIRNGTRKPSHKDGCMLFIKEDASDTPPYCVAHIPSGEIITVGWRE